MGLFDDFYRPRPKPAFNVGTVDGAGAVNVVGDQYTNSPRVNGLNIAGGSDVITMTVDGQEVPIATGGFHS